METTVEVLAHTKHWDENPLHELVTLRVSYPRFILAEVNTYRTFSRCYSSSRAIPSHKVREIIQNDPTIPPKFGSMQAGMNMGDEVNAEDARNVWLEARDAALECSDRLTQLNIHKSVSNRLTEPFTNINGVITAELGPWLWFLRQRLDENADPAIQVLAKEVQKALKGSTPRWDPYMWHIPYILEEEKDLHHEERLLVSAARCARSSYTPHGEPKMDTEKDLKLARRLCDAGHYSPFEHQAVAFMDKMESGGNFRNWEQQRNFLDTNSKNEEHQAVWLAGFLGRDME